MLLLSRAVAGRRDYAGLFTRRITLMVGFAALLGTMAACSGTEPRIPSALSLSATTISFTSLGEEHQLSPSITDQEGDPLPEEIVNWSSSNPAVASVSQTGLVTAQAPGSAEITAAAGMASATAQVTVVQAPAQLQKISGDGQEAVAGQLYGAPMVVQVNDARGNPISGAVVNFAASAGGGRVGFPVRTTETDGRTSTTATAGNAAGLPQAVSARLPNTTITETFTASATAAASTFNIEIQYLSSATATQQQAFSDARVRWENAIFGDLQDGLLQANAGDCGSNSPAVDRIVDDVLILVTLDSIDGPGDILGGASPCYIRDPGDLTILGFMRFDRDDLAALEADGLLSTVVEHEMGHVFGFGTLWELQDLLAEASLPPTLGTDPHFTGTQAREAFDIIGGTTYAGTKVPVEDMGDVGTADSHWRESVFGNELMTGFITSVENPLSIVTLASFADQGYRVDLAAAESYSLMQALRLFAASTPTFQLRNDLPPVPIKKVDASGRVTGEIRR